MAKTPLDRLANLGEEMLGKAAQNPNLSRLVHTAAALRDRVDDLTRRVRGLEAMEQRIDELEQRVAKLERPPKKATSSRKGA